MKKVNRIIIVDDEPEALAGYLNFLDPQDAPKVRTTSRRPSKGSEPSPQPAKGEFQVLKAESGEEAVKIFKSEFEKGNRIAAGFFDVKMPGGMDGLQTILAIKEIDPEVYCVVVTAYHDRTVDEIQELFGDDFKDQWDYLNKPFTQGEIVQKARQMVAAWNGKRERDFFHQQVVKSERLAGVGQVARGVGHEVGNILVRVIGKVDLALMEKDVEKIHKHLDAVMEAAERAGIIIRNLQSFSKHEPQLKTLSIEEAVESSLSLIHQEITKNSITLKKELSSSPPVQMDKNSMAQVFLNLFINAIHAMEGMKDGVLTINSCEAKGKDGKKGALVEVSDTGTGIPAEVLPNIFEYTFTTKGERGSGLGLAISKEIMDAHMGTLEVQTLLGKGSTFRVWLPQSEEAGE